MLQRVQGFLLQLQRASTVTAEDCAQLRSLLAQALAEQPPAGVIDPLEQQANALCGGAPGGITGPAGAGPFAPGALPNTGDGGLAADGGGLPLLTMGAALAGAAALLAGLRLRRRARR